MSQPRSAHQDYRPDIDGLRAAAVLAVIAFHAFPDQVPGGFVGVDIFFVISGYLISGIIFKNLEQGTFRFSEFYQRRVRRIFPALTIVLIACLGLGWLVLLPDEYRQLVTQTATAAAFVSNFTSWQEVRYFAMSANRNPLLHLWSLGIEEQFYLLWPACLVLLWKRKSMVWWTVAALTAVSFGINLARVGKHPSATFYLPFARFWELFLGGILAYHDLFQGGLRARKLVRNVLAIAGAVLIATALVYINPNRAFPGWWALLPTAGSMLLIAAGPDAWLNRAFLSNRAMVFIGLISYPLYLWHWPLFSFARILTTPTTTLKLALILSSFVLAWATWKFVERKLRRRASQIGPSADMVALVAGLASTGLVALLLFSSHGRLGRRPDIEVLAKDLDASANDLGYAACPAQLGNLTLCLQTKAGPVDAAVVGDSHAQRLFAGLKTVDPGKTWLAIGNYSCLPVLGVVDDSAPPTCAKTREALEYVSSRDGLDAVVFSFYGYYWEGAGHEGTPHFHLVEDPQERSEEEIVFRGLANSIQFVLAHHKRVFLVIDVPRLSFDPRNCVRRALFSKTTTCFEERSVVDQDQLALRRVISRLAEHFPQIVVFDPLPFLCDSVQCNVVLEGVSYYQDDDHLSQKGSELIARPLAALIDGNFLKKK